MGALLVPQAQCWCGGCAGWCRGGGAGAAGAGGGGSPKADVRHATFVHGARTSQ